MKLWDCKLAPNPRRARIFMAEKGLDVPKQEVDIFAGANLAPEYLAINPWGLLPALELDDGTVISEVPCIFRYLESLHPEPNLLGRDPIETAHIGAWERFAEMQGMSAIGEFFRNKTEAFDDRALPGYRGVPRLPALVERAGHRIAWFYAQMEQRLAKSEFLGCGRHSAADITALCAIDFGTFAGHPIPPGNSHTLRWSAAVHARPSCKA